MRSSPEDNYAQKRWKQVQYLSDLFWRRWTKEYLVLLQQRQRWTTLREDLKVGSVVLSLDEKLPRGTWPLGRVMEIKRSSDGRVRSAVIKTEQGVYHRPISKMCLLLESDTEDQEI